MKIFIDTANLKDIAEASQLGILDGVTTNPSLMAKVNISGKENIHDHYKAICELCPSLPVSAEVLSTDYDSMIKEGEELYNINPSQIVVKIPMIEDGIKAISYFSKKGIPTNCTLIFSAGQAFIAAKAGARFVSPFLGRLDDISHRGIELVSQIRLIFDNYGFDTEILAASIRHTDHIVTCAELGSDVITAPLKPIKGLLNHPLTDIGLAKFIQDSKKLI